MRVDHGWLLDTRVALRTRGLRVDPCGHLLIIIAIITVTYDHPHHQLFYLPLGGFTVESAATPT